MPENHRKLMPPCPAHEENLVLLHYGDLAATEAEPLRSHVRACSACAAYLSDLGALLPLTVAADEPAPAFWSAYDRELRSKIDHYVESKTWVQRLAETFQPRWMPAFATAAVVALTLTLTLGRGTWSPQNVPDENAAILELLPLADNLEFFNNMELLDHLDVLESMGSQRNAS